MKKYVHKGFADFSKGIFGNGGQNLYVSKKGVLQRIFNFDTTGNGCFDIMITNSHDYNEKVKLTCIKDPASEEPILQQILTDGCHGAAVADLNDDGYDDLVIVSKNNGHISDLPAFVYYGGPEGFTENYKINLAAPGCYGVACGDFNGDGLCDIAFLIKGGKLRIYTQQAEGFFRNSFIDLPIELIQITADDLDGDGYGDLYCRVKAGPWIILWGGPDGFDLERKTVVGPATDDTIFNSLPFGGGNLRYEEEARPKVLTIRVEKRLLYCGNTSVTFFKVDPKSRNVTEDFSLPIPGVISGTVGNISGMGTSDLVLICRPADGPEELVVLYEKDGFDTRQAVRRPLVTPRDVIAADFSGNGYDDIVVCQGRDTLKYTTESVMFCTGPAGIGEEEKRYVTHDALCVLAARPTGEDLHLIFANHQQSSTYGHVPAYIYTGDKDGWKADRRVELPGHSPGSMIPADFDDDGYADVLLINDGEDQPSSLPPSYIYHGGPNGLDPEKRTAIPSHLTWCGQVGDINKDGYLDLVFTSCNQQKGLNKNIVTVFYGSEKGYCLENTQTVEIAPPEKRLDLQWACLADLNGDGWLDLALSISLEDYTLILWGGPDGFSMERSTKLPVEGSATVRVADLNKDGYPDLIIGTGGSKYYGGGHQGSLYIFWGGPDGYSASRCCELPAYTIVNITVADFNNDGYLDIFVSCYLHSKERDINSFIYWNDKGAFSETNRKRIFAHSSAASLACDLNEDGYVDLIVASHRAYGDHNTQVAIWWNGPDGFKEENRSFLPCMGPHDMVGVDLGNILDRGPEEYYTSAPIILNDGEHAKEIYWEATVPIKTWIHATLRAADSLDELEKRPFVGPDGTENTYYKNHSTLVGITGKYVQYKLVIGATNNIGTPRITEVGLKTE